MQKIHSVALKCSNYNTRSLCNNKTSSSNNQIKMPSSFNNQSHAQLADIRVGAKVKKRKDWEHTMEVLQL